LTVCFRVNRSTDVNLSTLKSIQMYNW